MRTTLTLDEDVAAKLAADAHRTRKTFKATVNDVLRRGLAVRCPGPLRPPFKVVARDLGRLRPGLTLDNIAELLERVEGPAHR